MRTIYSSASLALSLLLVVALTACGKDEAADHQSPQAAGQDADGHATKEGEAAHAQGPEQTTIARAEADAGGIKVATVGPGQVASELEAPGLVRAADGSVAYVSARYPGKVRALRANVGDTVKAGQALASVESNLSLTTYTVASPISGVVLSRQAQAGAGATEGQTLFEVADFSKVWVDVNLFGGQVIEVQPGQRLTVTRLYDGKNTSATIDRILPGTSIASQSAIARAMLDNGNGQWRPGTAVTALIATRSREAALVIPRSAIQTMDGADAVFVRSGETYSARPVKLGETDIDSVEVLDGLRAGEEIVVEQSYLIKADIEKSGAAHED